MKRVSFAIGSRSTDGGPTSRTTIKLVERLIREAQRLSPNECRRLVARLERSLLRHTPVGMRSSAKEPYARSLALAGTVHTTFDDVSSDKYGHVGEAVAPSRSCS